MNFKLLNSIDPNAAEDHSEHKGIGLDNVIRRLQLLYKDSYQCEVIKMDEVFVVTLGLPLEQLEQAYVDASITVKASNYEM